jgi:putative MATE family efflux protein
MTIKLAVPVLIGHLLNLLYTVVDTLFISMLDKDSTAVISGIGLVLPIYMLVIALGVGVFAGISSILARTIGEQRFKSCDRIVSSGVFLATVIALLYLILLIFFGNDLLHLLAGNQITQAALDSGKQYFYFFLPGLFLLLVFFAFAGVAQGAGLVQYFAMAMMLSTLCNIALDPLFIFGFKMGVKGAALASSISIGLALFFLSMKLKSAKMGFTLKIGFSFIRKIYINDILRIAVPQILSLAVISIGMMSLNNIVGSVSETDMNSWVLVVRMDEFILIFGYALGSATLTQVGQNFGQNDPKRVMSIYHTNLIFSIAVGVVIAVIYNLLAYPLFSLFSTVPEVIQKSVYQVRVISFSFIGILALLVSNAMFQGTGKATPGLILNIFRMILIILPLSYLAIFMLKSGIVSLFYVIVLGNILTLIVTYLWSKSYLRRLVVKGNGKV